MGKKKSNYNPTGIGQLANDKPIVYRIKTKGGNTNYIVTTKKGRVQERIAEHIGEIPGATVQIKQFSSIKDARKNETAAIKRTSPKYNKQ